MAGTGVINIVIDQAITRVYCKAFACDFHAPDELCCNLKNIDLNQDGLCEHYSIGGRKQKRYVGYNENYGIQADPGITAAGGSRTNEDVGSLGPVDDDDLAMMGDELENQFPDPVQTNPPDGFVPVQPKKKPIPE